MIKAIFFDIGRVLVDFSHQITCGKLTRYSDQKTATEIYGLLFLGGLEKAYDLGEITSESFYEEAVRLIGAKDLSYRDFAEIWGDIFTPNKEIDKIMGKIPAHIRKLVLSNTNDLHWHYLRKMEIIREHFRSTDQQVLSFRVGTRKPDRKIFDAALEKAGVQPGEALFIDDTEEHVRAFTKLGGQAFLYDCRDHRGTDLETALCRFGILPC